jgi:hypothetical protein
MLSMRGPPSGFAKIRMDVHFETLHWWDMTTSAPRSGYNQVDLS